MDWKAVIPKESTIIVFCNGFLSDDRDDPFRKALTQLKSRLTDATFVVPDEFIPAHILERTGVAVGRISITKKIRRVNPCIFFGVKGEWGGFAFHGTEEPIRFDSVAARKVIRDYIPQKLKQKKRS